MIISPKTEEKAMRAIIDYCEAYPSRSITEKFLIYKNVCDESEVQHLIAVLCSKNLITYEYERDLEVIRLTPNGTKYFEDALAEQRKEHKTSRRYWITTIIAILALVLAAISLAAQLDLIQLPVPSPTT